MLKKVQKKGKNAKRKAKNVSEKAKKARGKQPRKVRKKTRKGAGRGKENHREAWQREEKKAGIKAGKKALSHVYFLKPLITMIVETQRLMKSQS